MIAVISANLFFAMISSIKKSEVLDNLKYKRF